MSSRLLTLSFHTPNILLKEDAMFKGYGLASPLLDSESLGDKIPVTLAQDKDSGPASGISGASYSVGTKKTFQISLNELGVNTWWRPAFELKGKFETWIEPKLKQPCVCLLVGGHHAMLNDWPVVWGQEDRRKKNRFFTALLPEKSNDNKPILKIEGNPYQSGHKAVLRALLVEVGLTTYNSSKHGFNLLAVKHLEEWK